MKTVKYHIQDLINLFNEHKVITMNDMKKHLGTSINMTVLRKLRQLSYTSSYSHRGKYYTLDSIAEYDKRGLWSTRNIYFSIFGTLLETACHFVHSSKAGYSCAELSAILCVETKESLLTLLHQGHVLRERIADRYFYFSSDETIRRKQILKRKENFSRVLPPSGGATSIELLGHELKAALILFYSLLNEQQRRFFAGLESLKIGRGGDSVISQLLGIDARTVARGRSELLSGDITTSGVRRSGGGRKGIKKKTTHYR